MKKNFNIKDGVLFELSSETIDLRSDCELGSVEIRPGESPCIEMRWRIDRSNQYIHIHFTSVEDFIVRGRHTEYPTQSGAMLAIAGFSNGAPCGGEDHFYVEPTQEMSYMSFVMDDMSIFLIKAQLASMRRV